jgi:prepilin-type N-terminal cleavage/methylation domain-containing protein
VIATLRARTGVLDEGFTLVETLVAIVITGIVATLVTTLTITSERQSGATEVRLHQLDGDRIGMDAVSKTLRTAVEPSQLQFGCTGCNGAAALSTAIVAGGPGSITFYANLNDPDAGPDRVTVERDGTRLVEKTQPPDEGSAPNFSYDCTSCARTRTLVRHLANPAGSALFTYYDGSGDELDPSGETERLSSADLKKVSSVDVTLRAHTKNGYGVPATTVRSRVSLPNANALPSPNSSGG